MNAVDLNSVRGIINTVACCDDFTVQYDVVIGTNLYFNEELDLTLKYGLILMNINKEKAVNVPLSIKSYLNMKTPSDTQIMNIQTIHSLINVISNKFDINIVVGFIKDVHGEYFESYIILESMGEFICVNVPISDIFAIKAYSRFPVFLNKEIIKKRGIDYSEFLEHIDIGMWRIY